MNSKLLLGLAALLALSACDQNKERPVTAQVDAGAMPQVPGCEISRHVVRDTSQSTYGEVLYIARCRPTQTTSVTQTHSCGKNCTQKVTTITTIEGTPEEAKQ